MEKAQVGLIGLAVMGENLALNIAGKGIKISVYNRTVEKVDDFLKRAGSLPVYGARSMADFIDSLEKPRKIIIMIKAGGPVDEMIEMLASYLDKDDIIIDAGNSFFEDTRKRYARLKERGLRYVGMGVSGGEEGALLGPSLMPGGDKSAVDAVWPILVKIAAQVEDKACVCYMGEDGAGHFVKTVHNGIEYADMQLISEAYYILYNMPGMDNEKLADIFADWNKSSLESYLIEITSEILRRKDDDTDNYLVDMILDQAEQKGTGKWTAQSALELGVAVPTIAEAVFARCISAQKKERVAAQNEYNKKVKAGEEFLHDGFAEDVKRALYAAKICCYAQGFSLFKAAAKEYNWQMNFEEIALIWRGGCIIRANMLSDIARAFRRQPEIENLLIADEFIKTIKEADDSWRKVVNAAQKAGLAIPALSSTLSYYDSYTTGRLPANLLQAQRDFFGAHTYKRMDKEGSFHSKW